MSDGADALIDYTRELFASEDDVLRRIRDRQAAEGLPAIHISADEAKLLQILLQAVGARRVLEIGSLGGYSGTWIARALPPGGALITVENDARHAMVARAAYEDAGISDRVQLLEGNAIDVLQRLEGPFDAAFIDADKEPMPVYYEEAMGLVRVGGLLLGDNAFHGGSVVDPADRRPDTLGVREFNRRAASDPRLSATIVPVRDGLLVGVKVAA